MGLDQYWIIGTPPEEFEELHYHRKVPALQAFMQEAYTARHRDDRDYDPSFNMESLAITHEILDELEDAIVNDTLDTEATGFFWGRHFDEDVKDIETALNKAREALNLGKHVEYYASY